jgi:hypothetical protein
LMLPVPSIGSFAQIFNEEMMINNKKVKCFMT